MDERLDKKFEEWNGSEVTVEPVRIVSSDDEIRKRVLRGVDPDNLHLYFFGNCAELLLIEKELIKLRQGVDSALKKLEEGRIAPLYKK